MDSRTFVSRPYYCWVFEQFTILRNKLIEWAFMPFIWIEGKAKKKKMNKLPKWTIILRSSYHHQWHNLFRIFMIRIIHEHGCSPNKTEAQQIKRNHNPVLCFYYGIRDSRIISSEHKINPMILHTIVSRPFEIKCWTQYKIILYNKMAKSTWIAGINKRNNKINT